LLASAATNTKSLATLMKIYILTDLEGAAGVSRFSQTRDYREDPEQKREARELLTTEVNAAVDGILDVAANAEVVVLDGHGNGGIDIRILHPKAKLIARGPVKPPYFLDESYDALFFVGQHAMAGVENAPLCHTYSSKTIEYYKINGRLIGEFGARAILAGTFGVPTVFLAGDDKAADEARQMVPGIVTAEVKEGLGLELALHLSPAAARALIRRKAAEAVASISRIPPTVVDPPYEQEIRVLEGVSLDHYLERGAVRVDDRTAIKRSEVFSDLFV
jgi:D-amino peptidase